jgi:tryptophanyl-tRNA synthetase
MRPSGKLHIGHYFGALKNWIDFQKDFDSFHVIVDWHAMTSEYEDPKLIAQNTIEMAVDWIAAGLDPEKCTIFVQSNVPQHAELHLMLSMITPLPRLERIPTYKEQLREVTTRNLQTYGFLGYPVLQAADIIIYKANFVPVGQDQISHVEFTRELANRFNTLYKEVFPLPEYKLTKTPILPGTDGRKMSKSYGNSIFLSDSPDIVREKVRNTFSNPQRARLSDPGDPEQCNVFHLHKIFTDPETIAIIDTKCRTAGIGCVACKMILADRIIDFLNPIQKKREMILSDKGYIPSILREGAQRASDIASKTMREVKEAVGLKNYIVSKHSRSMSAKDEIDFIAPYIDRAAQGEIIKPIEIRKALNQRLGKEVTRYTVYRIRKRYGLK